MLKQLPMDVAAAFLPLATLAANLEDLASRFHFHLEDGIDDLDRYKAVHLQTGRGLEFVLIRYSGTPKDQIDVYMTKKQFHMLPVVIDELHISSDKVNKRVGSLYD